MKPTFKNTIYLLCALVTLGVSVVQIARSQSKKPKLDPINPPYRLSGKDLYACLVAFNALKSSSDLAESKKQLSNYTVEVTVDDKFYYIHLTPKNDTTKTMFTVGGETAYGREIKYKISKAEYSVVGSERYR